MLKEFNPLKTYFFSGLAILLPLVITFVIFMFFINLLTAPFMGMTLALFDALQISDFSIGYVPLKDLIPLLSRATILLLLIAAPIVMGTVCELFLFKNLAKGANAIIQKIPFISTIYKAVQEVTTTLLKSQGPKFSQVVLVPFPSDKSLSIGLVTKNEEPGDQQDLYGDISVFVPATPNPTVGFMILYKREQLEVLDMTVEEAIKFIVSCGTITELELKKKQVS